MSDTATFLDQAIPWPTQDHPGYVNIHSPWLRPGAKKPSWPGHAFTHLNGAVGNVSWRAKQNNDVYVCMSLQKDAHPAQKGKRNRRAMRHADAAVMLRAFWLDADTKNFASLEDLLTKAKAFREAVGLPVPSFVNFTGGGCHFFWVLPEAITPEVWQPVADALAAAAEQHKFAADWAITKNPACLMRVPGTYNYKYDPPREAKIIHIGGLIPLADMAGPLAPYKSVTSSPHRATYAPRVTITLPPGSKPSAVFAGAELGPSLTEGLEPEWKPSIDEVKVECPWIRDTLANGGANCRENEWYESVKVAYYTREGVDAAHRLSKDWKGYDRQETQEKYDDVVRYHAGDRLGWPQCQTIKSSGATQCATCPHLAADKSPLNFVNPAPDPTGAAADPPSGDPPPPGSPPPGSNGAATSPPPFIPKPYRYNSDGFIEWEVQDKNDKDMKKWEVIYPVRVNGFIRQVYNKEMNYGREMVYFQFEDEAGYRPAQVKMSGVHDLRKFREVLSEQGMAFKDHEAQNLGRYILSFVQQLRNAQHLSVACEPYGWSMKQGVEDAFVFDSVRFNCNGNKQIAPPDVEVGEKFKSVGSLDIWKAACKLVTDQKRPELNALVACGLAGPLVQMTGHSGFVVSAYSTATGVQKSAAMKVGQAMWGHPVGGMAGLDDTNNFLNARLAALRHLPLFVDELRFVDEFRKAEIMVLGITQGKSKGRLTRSSDMMPTNTFNTLMVTAGNLSLVQHIADHAKTTTAGMARIFEFVVERGDGTGMVDTGIAQSLIGRLEYNYGTAGRVYAEFLGQNVDRVRKDVLDTVAKVNGIVDGTSDERFWVATISVLLVGAKYGNELGLTQIDTAQLRDFLLRQYHHQRRESETSTANLGQAPNLQRFVVDYIHARTQQTVKTDKVNKAPGRGGPKVDVLNNINALPRGAITVHAVRDQGLVILSESDFGNWLVKERKVSRHEILKAITEKLPATQRKGALGRGTHYAGANERVLEFDVSKMPDIDLF